MDRQVALITGSGRRLGRQIALALAENGYDIIINYYHSGTEARKTEREIKRTGRRCLLIKADITKRDQVLRMMKQTIKTFGKIDVLVNNAGIFVPPTGLTDLTEDVWDRVIDTNLKGTFLCAQAAGEHMLKRRSGKIINIASLGAFKAWANHIPYCVSKAGVVMLTQALAKALAPFVTVNAVAPGTIIIPREKEETILPDAEKIPLKKYGKPEDITDVVVFLANASDYMTGQVIRVDGGVTIP